MVQNTVLFQELGVAGKFLPVDDQIFAAFNQTGSSHPDDR
jgi:hypothetical protein